MTSFDQLVCNCEQIITRWDIYEYSQNENWELGTGQHNKKLKSLKKKPINKQQQYHLPTEYSSINT